MQSLGISCRFVLSNLCIIFALLVFLPPRNSDPGSYGRALLAPPHYGSCLAFLSQRTFSPFFPHRLSSNFLEVGEVNDITVRGRPMTMVKRCCKNLFPNYSKEISAEDTRTAAMRKNVCFSHMICVRGCTRRNLSFALKIVNTLIKNSSRDDRTSISTYNQSTANLFRVGQGQRMQVTASKISGGSVVEGVRSCPRRPTLFSQT